MHRAATAFLIPFGAAFTLLGAGTASAYHTHFVK